MSNVPESPTPQPIMPGALAQRLLGAGGIPEVFANQMRMSVTVTDFTIVFGVAVDNGSGPATLADKVAIHVAPGMLKQVLLNIEAAIDAYEEVIGEIKIPKGVGLRLAGTKAQLASVLRQNMEGPGGSSE